MKHFNSTVTAALSAPITGWVDLIQIATPALSAKSLNRRCK